ncbi:MAG: DUF3857 domain-containing protein [bacterium]|nr:DUF3857 domain-containing protein [bacterium]
MSKRYVVFVILLLASSRAFSVSVPDWLEAMASTAAGSGDFPNASVLVLRDYRQLNVDSGGAATSYVEQCLKLLDDRAKDEQGDRSIRFDSERDTVIFDAVYTRQADGRWIEPEKDAFTVTSAPEVQWASAYSQLKQQNVSFPGLAAGAVIYWKYRVVPKSGRTPWADDYQSGIVTFGGFEPVADQRFEIVADTTYLLWYELQNSPVTPTQAVDGVRRTLTWSFQNLRQLTPEPDMVGISHLVPRLIFTTFEDWSELGLYVGERFWRAVEHASYAQTQYALISTPGTLSGHPLARNIAFWVQQNIRTVPLGLGAVGYEPNDADDVWANRYGDVRDKLVLLSALLGAYGINSYPVLLQASNAPFSQLPSLDQFNQMLLAVPVDADTIFLDPLPKFSPPDEITYGRSVGMSCQLILGAPLLEPAGDLVRQERRATVSMSLTLDTVGTLAGQARCDVIADFAASARATFTDQKQQEREIYFQRAASRIGQGCEVIRSEVSDPKQLAQPMRVSMDFSCPDFAVKQGDLLLVDIPVSPFAFASAGFYPSLPTVKYPVDLPMMCTVSQTIIISYPKGYQVAYLPNRLLVANPFMSIEVVPKQLADRIEWQQSVTYSADMVSVEDYPSLRAAFESLIAPKNRLFVLEKAK